MAVPLQARNGEADTTPDEILQMVKQLAAPPHRWAPKQHCTPCSNLGLYGSKANSHTYRTTLGCRTQTSSGLQVLPLSSCAALRPASCRLILFLQQSSVEWASSLWMHVVQELDPTYQRTVRVWFLRDSSAVGKLQCCCSLYLQKASEACQADRPVLILLLLLLLCTVYGAGDCGEQV